MPVNSNTKKVSISLMGASGKMGQIVTQLAQEDPDIEIVDEGDLIIDFSKPEGTAKAIEMGKPLVCGTTGLSDSLFQRLKILSEKVPVLYSSNFSLGMALCFEMLEGAREQLKKFCEITIQETHHQHKVDAPSGSALKLGEFLDVDAIQSERVGEVIGTHQVNFSLNDEQITLKHEAFSRKAFARGALLAAKFIFNKPPKFYTIKDVFC